MTHVGRVPHHSLTDTPSFDNLPNEGGLLCICQSKITTVELKCFSSATSSSLLKHRLFIQTDVAAHAEAKSLYVVCTLSLLCPPTTDKMLKQVLY